MMKITVNYPRYIQVVIVLGVILWGTWIGAAPLSLYSSFSIRSPKQRPNPFDYELAFGLQINYIIAGVLDIQRERDNGKMYTNQEYKVCYQRRWSDVNVRYYDDEEDRLFIRLLQLAPDF